MRKEILDLLKDKKAMKEGGLFIVDTEKILGEAIAAGFEIKHFVYCESGLKIVDKYGDTMGHGVCETTKSSFIERFANVSTHQGFLAVVQSVNRQITSFHGGVMIRICCARAHATRGRRKRCRNIV